jgi:hypothetical protein
MRQKLGPLKIHYNVNMHVTNLDIQPYLDALPSFRKKDILNLVALIQKVTSKQPRLWGSIIGFGRLHYRYATGREGEMPLVGVASRKQTITLYLSFDISQYPHLQTLGQHSIGKGCLYIKRLEDIHLPSLENMLYQCIQDTLSLPFITNLEKN